MSARDSLEYVLLKYFSGTEDVTREMAGGLERLQATGLIDEFAHELAEQGRKVMGPRHLIGEPEHVARYVSGWHDAMDHIDPEAQK